MQEHLFIPVVKDSLGSVIVEVKSMDTSLSLNDFYLWKTCSWVRVEFLSLPQTGLQCIDSRILFGYSLSQLDSSV